MGREQRIALIQQIEQQRGSFVITYLTNTRAGLEVPMAMDIIRKFYEHLVLFQNENPIKNKIELFIVSNGGDGIVPWRLVTLIRTYVDEFNVLIPYRAFSAATLTALGANHIFMHPMGMLGPTDPSVYSPYNPDNPQAPGQKLPISVEDVTSYVTLVKEDFGIRHEDELIESVKALTDKVHPLALGSVKRSLAQSKMIAEKLLKLHMHEDQQHKIDGIIENLTSKLFFHGHPINRKEAKEEIQLPIEDRNPELENLIWNLYCDYENEMKSDEVPFNPLNELIAGSINSQMGVPVTVSPSFKLAYIESKGRSDYVQVDYKITGVKQPNGYQLFPPLVTTIWHHQ